MLIASWILFGSFLAPPMSQPARVEFPANFLAAADVSDSAQRQRPNERAPRTYRRPHKVGLGGTMAVSSRGAGGAMRYWFNERVGVNTNVSYSRSRYTVGGSRPNTFQAVPSIVILLTKPNKDRDIDVRPYIGGGPNYTRMGGLPQIITPASPELGTFRSSGMGMQAFGGIEVTFKEYDAMTISAEEMYYRSPIGYSNLGYYDRWGYIVGVHFYLK